MRGVRVRPWKNLFSFFPFFLRSYLPTYLEGESKVQGMEDMLFGPLKVGSIGTVWSERSQEIRSHKFKNWQNESMLLEL